ncbi:MAG: FKBP-type peptidyl-prolyl cis-trans isomerase [Paludibacter sp.]|nr:FKBP-type peptidyl-prolyl cis-trans isomerase [Paludibacter sp.]
MLELNRKLIEYEDSTLAVYIKNTQQPFVRDSLGYWYKINSETMQKNVAHGSVFNIEYVVYSLDNKLLAKQTANITLGKKQTAAAIEDVLQKLPAGCAATLIAPYYLAYGARGDGANIKPYQAVRIEVKIMEE